MTLSVQELRKIVDIVIIAVRADEVEALQKHFPTVDRTSGRHEYDVSQVKRDDQQDCVVVLVRSTEGPLGAQGVMKDVIAELAPDLTLTVGIGGAVPQTDGNLMLGDVVVSSGLLDVMRKELTYAERAETKPRPFALHDGARKLVESISIDPAWSSKERICVQRPIVVVPGTQRQGCPTDWAELAQVSLRLGAARNVPRWHRGTVASGPDFVKDPAAVREWQKKTKKYRDDRVLSDLLLATEMESVGVHHASIENDRHFNWVSIRGISDLIGLERDKAWDAYACATPAAFTLAFVRSLRFLPRRSRDEQHIAQTKQEEATGARNHPIRPKKSERIPEFIRTVRNRGSDLLNRGHMQEAKAEFQRALVLAEEAHDSYSIIDSKENLAAILSHADHDATGARALLESCLHLLASDNDDEQRSDVLARLAHTYELDGDLELSESLQRQSILLSEKLGHKQVQAGALVQLAWTVGRRGRTDEAFDLNMKAYDLLAQLLHDGLRDDEDNNPLVFIHTVLGNLFFQRAKIYQRRGEPDGAEQALETALKWQRKVPPNHELAKLLRELAELRFFRRDLNAGFNLLREAAVIYQEREMYPDLAACLHLMGRAFAAVGRFDKAKEYLEQAAGAALRGGRSQETADVLLSLGHLNEEQGDRDTARQLFEAAKAATDKAKFRAECLMVLRKLAIKEERKDDAQQLLAEAIELLKADLTAAPLEQMAGAKSYFTLGWYLREAGRLDEAFAYVGKARERFEAACDAYGAAQAAFEMAGLLDHMGRKGEALEMVGTVRRLIEGKPFYEIAAAVDLSLARFALHEDNDVAEAGRLADHGLGLCKEHDLPMLHEAMLFKDEVEARKRAGTEPAASIQELLGSLREQRAMCPANRDGYLRLWMFCHAREFQSALRGSLGPNFAILTSDLPTFFQVSEEFRCYRDWSLIVPPEEYPDNILEVVPFADKMLIPADGTALLARKKKDDTVHEEKEGEEEKTTADVIRASPEIRAALSLSGLAVGGSLARYYFVSLEKSAHEFGGATAGLQGWSLSLPPAAHALLEDENIDSLRAKKLFFVYFNRGRLEDEKRLWYDLTILKSFRCIPVYPAGLPNSPLVRIVSSCSFRLPAVTAEAAQTHKKALRGIRRGLQSVMSAGEEAAACQLADLEAMIEDFAAEAGLKDGRNLTLYVLAFDEKGETRTHAAIALK